MSNDYIITPKACPHERVLLANGCYATLTHDLFCGAMLFKHTVRTDDGATYNVLPSEFVLACDMPDPPNGWTLTQAWADEASEIHQMPMVTGRVVSQWPPLVLVECGR